MKVVNNMQGQKAIAMKIKLSYNIGGQTISKDAVINTFPSTY